MSALKRRLSMVIMIAMIITSCEFLTVFAEDSSNSGDGQTAPKAVSKLEAHPGYLSVILKWKASPGADEYIIYMNGKEKARTKKTTYKIKNLPKYKNQKFEVVASNEAGRSEKVSKSSQPVREMAYRLSIKRSGTLNSHGGRKATYRARAGKKIDAVRFAGGKYVFFHNGSTFYVARTRVGKKKAIYTTKFNYSKTSAENYVNDMRVTSRTNYLVWVSTYTQHTYLFKGSKGKWKVIDDWECATGLPGSPTPSGVSGKKAIWKKIKTRHGLKWWSSFSSTNSFHGLRKGWKTGKPASNGCVRTPTEKSKIIYQKCKIGTKVLIQ